MKRVDPSKATDAWYESEESTRLGMIAELQRIVRRTRVRPIPVILMAALITSAIVYRVATKKVLHEAEVVLSLQQGALATKQTSIPVDQLREYVTSVLIPDGKLVELIERRNLYRLRKKLGNDFAVEQIREQLEVKIWKNSFLYYDEEDEDTLKSARIGVIITDEDPDLAFGLARDIAGIVIATAAQQRQDLADKASHSIAQGRSELGRRLDELTTLVSQKQAAFATARAQGKASLAEGLKLEIAGLAHDVKAVEAKLDQFATSNEGLADRIAKAGLDMSLTIVEEQHPEVTQHSSFVLIMLAVVIGTFGLLGSALVLGAFDPRVHDADDVARLGLPVLGHVPGFPGDNVGSLSARGAVRRRVPLFLRWR